jgi:hypothetical protein
VLRGEVLAPLRIEVFNYEVLSLIDAVSPSLDEPDTEMEHLDHLQAFQAIQQDDLNLNIKEEEF